MEVRKIAPFSHNNQGGNPAGVVICNEIPTETKMLQTAKHVGYSETAFLEQMDDGWKIRYFASETEVPFCGHATIASGAVLGDLHGEGTYRLYLNQGERSIEILQGQDMGIPSQLFVQFTENKGESIKVSGETRRIIETDS